LIASELGFLDEEVVCGDEHETVEHEGEVDDVDNMVLLLNEGLPDDAE
jgi:hypothetical protein